MIPCSSAFFPKQFQRWNDVNKPRVFSCGGGGCGIGGLENYRNIRETPEPSKVLDPPNVLSSNDNNGLLFHKASRSNIPMRVIVLIFLCMKFHST